MKIEFRDDELTALEMHLLNMIINSGRTPIDVTVAFVGSRAVGLEDKESLWQLRAGELIDLLAEAVSKVAKTTCSVDVPRETTGDCDNNGDAPLLSDVIEGLM